MINKKSAFLLLLTFVILSLGLTIGILMVSRPQKFKEEARQPTPPFCPLEGATCRWQTPTQTRSISYQYIITDLTTGTVIKSGATEANSVHFTPLVGHQYECQVTPVNSCGNGPAAKTQNSCGLLISPSPAPSTTPRPSQQPRPTFTPSPKASPITSPFPTAISTSPTPTPLASISPAPPTPTLTLTPAITATTIPQPSATLAPTPLSSKLPSSASTNITSLLIFLASSLLFLGLKLSTVY